MNYLKLILLFTSTLMFSNDLSFKPDKQKHFAVSFILGGVSNIYLEKYYFKNQSNIQKIIIGSSIAIIPGILKELSDDQKINNKFDNADMAYNILGAISGNVIGLYFMHSFNINLKNKTIIYTKKF